MDSITLFNVVFLPHTWPLVFGLPSLLILMGIGGLVYELTQSSNK